MSFIKTLVMRRQELINELEAAGEDQDRIDEIEKEFDNLNFYYINRNI